MKKNKGFTLVELLAVVTLLAAIILIGVPSIINTLKNIEDRETEDFEKILKNAAELYVERNRNLFPELDTVGGSIDLDTNVLIQEGYLKNNLKNPQADMEVTDYIINVESSSDGILIYTVKGN